VIQMQEEQQRQGPQFMRSRDPHELKEKAIFGDKSSITGEEINPANASGFLNDEELQLVRRCQSMLSQIRFWEQRTDSDLSGLKHFILEKLNFLSYSSKSKDGAGVKAAISQIRIQDQNVYQQYDEDRGENKGFIQKLKSFGKKAQSGGATNFGSNIQYRSGEREKIWR